MLIYQISLFNVAKIIIMTQYTKYFALKYGIFPFFLTKISAAGVCDGYSFVIISIFTQSITSALSRMQNRDFRLPG